MFNRKLIGLSFFGLEKVAFDRVFFSLAKHTSMKLNLNFVELLKLLIRPFFHVPLTPEIDVNKESYILFFLTPVSRSSYFTTFKKVVSTLESKVVVNFPITNKKRIDVYSGMLYFFYYYPIWCYTLIKAKMDIKEIIIILERLFYLHQVQNSALNRLEIFNLKLAVVMFDFYTIDCYIIEFMKKRGIKTATLQHGQFVRKRFVANSIENSGIEYQASTSDYMLCWNQFSKNEALIEGVPFDKLKVLGIPTFIGDTTFWKCPNSKCFCVVLSHAAYGDENPVMIKAANLLANKFGYKYFIKYHPNYKGNEYLDIIEPNVYLGNVFNDKSINEWIMNFDFSIIGSTSLFVELVYLKHPVLRYSSRKETDKFRDVKNGLIFNSLSDDIFQSNELGIKFDDLLFDELCTIQNVEGSYYHFFNQFL